MVELLRQYRKCIALLFDLSSMDRIHGGIGLLMATALDPASSGISRITIDPP